MQQDLADVRRDLETQGIDIVRLLWPDVLGLPRSKDITVSQLERAAGHGPAFCQATWTTTTGGDVLDGRGSLSDGLSDMVSRMDASTIRPLPWEEGVAYAIADIDEADGSPNPIAPRSVLRRIIEEYKALGLLPVVGPELEFYFAHKPNDKWERILNKTGRVYQTGSLVDPDGTFLYLLRMLDRLNIGAFAGNHEFCPSQYEINLWHGDALDAADRTFLFKTAIKDITNRRGIMSTFIGKPWDDEGGSGGVRGGGYAMAFACTPVAAVDSLQRCGGVFGALAALHAYGVAHGDARLANLMVLPAAEGAPAGGLAWIDMRAAVSDRGGEEGPLELPLLQRADALALARSVLRVGAEGALPARVEAAALRWEAGCADAAAALAEAVWEAASAATAWGQV